MWHGRDGTEGDWRRLTARGGGALAIDQQRVAVLVSMAERRVTGHEQTRSRCAADEIWYRGRAAMGWRFSYLAALEALGTAESSSACFAFASVLLAQCVAGGDCRNQL
jgi:hypothetical protein